MDGQNGHSQTERRATFIDIWKCFPIISSYLTQVERIQLNSANSIIRQLTSDSKFWPRMQIGMGGRMQGQIEWFGKYVRKFKPFSVAISLFEVNESVINQMVKVLTEGVAEEVESLDIYCQSEDIHLACSLTFPNIEELTVRSKCVTNELVQFMATNLHKLHSLVIIKNDLEFTCKRMSKYIRNPMQKFIVKPHAIEFQEVELITEKSQNTLKQLEIDVEQCEQQSIIKILQPLRRLQKLRLYHLQNLQTDNQLWQALSKQSKIVQLALTKSYNFQMGRIINTIASDFLISLDITDSKFVNDDDIKFLAKGCPSLREVNLSWCNGVTEKGLAFLIEHCLNIESLHITGVKQSKDIIFGEEYNSLLKIFDDQKFTKIKDMGSCKPQLKESNQIYERNYFFKQKINYQKIQRLRKLKFLDCQSCNGISDQILKIIYVINPRVRCYNYYGNYMGLFPNDNQSTFC